MKKILSLLLLFCSIAVNAYNFEVDGIYYNVTNRNEKTVSVTYKDSRVIRNATVYISDYSGDMIIPSEVVYDSTTYKVTGIDSHAFNNCIELNSISMPTIEQIGWQAFYNCSNLKNINIPSVRYIYDEAFRNCISLTSISVPKIIRIESYAFAGCKKLASIIFSSSGLSAINPNAFDDVKHISFYTNKGSYNMLYLWALGYIPYDIRTTEKLTKPIINVIDTTQTSFTIRVDSIIDSTISYYYCYLDEQLWGKIIADGFKKTGLYPEKQYEFILYANNNGSVYGGLIPIAKAYIKTKPISPHIEIKRTSSSIKTDCSYIKGDAVIKDQYLEFQDSLLTSPSSFVYGLDPDSIYQFRYTIVLGSEEGENLLYCDTLNVKPQDISFTTSQPKVISEGNVIVQASANIDDEETNVGFEWRRTDWTDDFKSREGSAYLYEGTMETCIRSLNSRKLWKYRAYYESKTGKRYYSDWMGIDPTDVSYYEPTVHTYANINVDGNNVTLNGYVQRGSDNVESKGFMYWKDNNTCSAKANGVKRFPSVPDDAQIIEVKGSKQIMEVKLVGLDYNTTYSYVAFVTTSEGDTYYGDERSFSTSGSPTVIGEISINNQRNSTIGIYDLNGCKQSKMRRGVNIIRYNDGSVRKILVK